MIIWRGWGLLVVLFAGVGGIVTIAVAGPTGAGLHQRWAGALGFAVAAGLAQGLCYARARLAPVGVDERTGRKVRLAPRDHLYFIPMRVWPVLFLAVGAFLALAK